MLESSNQHKETAAAAGEQIKLPARQQDPKGPCKSSKFQGVSFNAQNKFWEAFLRDSKKSGIRETMPWFLNGGNAPVGSGTWACMILKKKRPRSATRSSCIKLGRCKGLDETGPCPLNFPLGTYAPDIEEMKECGSTESMEEYIQRLRAAHSVGFVRGKGRSTSGVWAAPGQTRQSTWRNSVTGIWTRTARWMFTSARSFEDKVEAGKCFDKAASDFLQNPRCRAHEFLRNLVHQGGDWGVWASAWGKTPEN